MSSTQGHVPQPHASTEPTVPGGGPNGRPPVWPQRAEYLTDSSRCPSCFTALSASTPVPAGSAGPVCHVCGLDLSGPDAAGVLEAGTAVRAAESKRQHLLDRMRATQAEREALRLAASAPVPQLAQVAQQQPVTVGRYPGEHFLGAQSPAASGPSAPATEPASLSALHAQLPPQGFPPAAGGAAADDRPRRSGIQILMLTVGVILVSIMAIFFVLLAYLVASLEVRSVLTGAASIAVFGIAWLLHRRRLSGTAQGIAVLAIVLLLLDIWIVRANDLFGSATLDGWLYTGIATGLLAVALTAGFRMLPLRSLSISAALLGPVAVFALTIGILNTVDAVEHSWAAFAAVGAAALAWRWVPLGQLERGLVRALGFLAAGLAILPASIAFPDLRGGAVIALAVIAIIWFGHLALSEFRVVTAPPPGADPAGADAIGVNSATGAPVGQEPPGDAPGSEQPSSPPRPGVTTSLRSTPWQVIAAIGLGVSVAAVGPALLFDANTPTDLFWLPATATALGAVVLAIAARLGRASDGAQLMRLATAVPLATTALAAAPAALSALIQLVSVLAVRPFSLDVLDPIARFLSGTDWAVPVALIAVSLLTASALALIGRLSSIGWASAALGAIGLLSVCVTLATPALSGPGLLVVTAAALVATASRRLAWPYRLVAAITSALGAFGVFAVGLTSTVSFPFAVLVTLAVLVVLHRIVQHAAPQTLAYATTPAIVASALVVLLGSVLLVPSWYQAVTGVTSGQAAPALALAVCSAVILLMVPFTRGFFTRAESAVAVTISAFGMLGGLFFLASRVSVDSTGFLIASGIAAAVTILWQFPRGIATWPERYMTAAAAPLVSLWFVSVLWDRIDDTVIPVAVSAAIVILAAGALAIFRPTHNSWGPHPAGVLTDPPQIARLCWDVTLILTAVPVVALAVGSERLGWLALLLLAVAAVIVASGEGGVFAGRSLRRHVAWAGLPLAVGSLWLGLARNDVDVVEFYTLPVSGLLLAILALIVIRREPPTARVSSPRTVLLGAALAVALLPSAAASGIDEPVRMTIALGAAIVLLLAGPFLPPVWHATRVAIVVWLTGVVTMLLLTLVLPIFDSTRTVAGWENEVAAAGLLAGGALWLYRRQVPHILGTLAVAAAPVAIALPLAESILAGEAELWRFLLTLLLASALFVAASLGTARSEIVRWTALGAAVVVAASAITVGLADPFETATVPIAIALIAVGAVRLTADPAARSWPHLGAGLILLLVPSLFADFASNELWRVVALGVAALVVFGIGLALKLSAPTLIGAAVLVVHGLAQLWPWISGLYGAIPWWLWAGIGGTILIVLAATYEKRIRDLRAVARSITSLR